MAPSATLPSSSDDFASLWWNKQPLFTPPIQYKHRPHSPRRRLYYLSHRGALSEPSRSRTKRLFDAASASLALLFFAPLFIAVALMIKLTSPGPVFFTQYRYGHRNQRFKIYKFRTMHVHLGDARGVQQTVSNDPRVTAFGRFLRRTSLDELPQLINVINGDMSLIGPRPHALAHDRFYGREIAGYDLRQTVKPGISGWAQVHGHRGATVTVSRMRERLAYDVWYARNASFALDVQIIIRTIGEVISQRNAY